MRFVWTPYDTLHYNITNSIDVLLSRKNDNLNTMLWEGNGSCTTDSFPAYISQHEDYQPREYPTRNKNKKWPMIPTIM